MAIEGYVDGIAEQFLVGWAYDADDPERRLELEILLDERPLARCVADIRRGDLEAAGIGDGRHGFRIPLDEKLAPGSEHVVSVRVVADGSVLPLANDYLAEADSDAEARPLVLRLPQLPPPMVRPAPPTTDPCVRPTTPVPRALAGPAGWLFSMEDLDGMRESLGDLPPTKSRVAAQRSGVLARHGRMRELGCAYVLASVPDKAAVYADRLPGSLTLNRDGRPAERLARALRDANDGELLDLLGALSDARQHGRVYQRAGSSWTWLGAFRAYRAIAKELAKHVPALEPRPPELLELGGHVRSEDPLPTYERLTLVGGQLAALLVDPDEPANTEPDLVRNDLRAMYTPRSEEFERRAGPGSAVLERPASAGMPHAIVVHDGVGSRVVTFLAEHFERTAVVVSDQLPDELILAERPAAVIQLLAEARLDSLAP